MADGSSDGISACCKVGRTASAYGLDGLDEALATGWRGDDSVGVRELASRVNRRVFAAAMREAGLSPLDGEPENLLRLLTDDDVPGSRRLDTRRRLEREGVDVDGVLEDTVSHQTVYNHLRDCLGVSKGTDEDRLERRGSTLYALKNRTETVTRETLASLRDGGEIDLGEFDVIVDVRVVCESCGRSHELSTVLDEAGCGCTTSY
jgi:DNA-binding transcriptional ArsR family regulator